MSKETILVVEDYPITRKMIRVALQVEGFDVIEAGDAASGHPMVPGELDGLTKEMVYLAVSAANGCEYCIASHTAGARRAGMTEGMRGELLAVVGMACETNALANAYRVPVDERFRA